MLEIKDLSKLKITKVKDWAIYFNYDGKKYLLYCGGDWEYYIKLYKRIPINNKGKYKLESIKSILTTSDCIQYDYIKYYGKTLCYSHIDKEYFVKKLTYKGFCCGLYDDYIKGLNIIIKNIDEQIENCQYQINELRQRKRELFNTE